MRANILAISFLVIYAIGLLSPAMPLVDYFFNQKEIAEKFCENKDKPELECNGKCHVAKQLKKNFDEDNPSSTINTLKWFDGVGFIQKLHIISPYHIEHYSYFKRISENEIKVHITLDHPPEIVNV